MFVRSTTLPTLDAPLRPITIRLSPVPDEELDAWARLLGRLPAVSTLTTAAVPSCGSTAVFTVEVASVARLQAQLQHLADRVRASFVPTADGALDLRLRPAGGTSRAWERVAAYRAAQAHGARPALGTASSA